MKQRALRAVRMVRERLEEREERALGEISRQVEQARATVERLREERAAILEAAMRGLGELFSGAEMQQRAMEADGLRQEEIAARAELQQLEQRREEQGQRYWAAHADCRAIAELQEQHRVAHLSALQGRERKAAEDLFLGRRTLLQQRLDQERTAA